MNWRLIWTLIRRDLKVVLKSKAVLIPLLMVPLVLLVLLPGAGAAIMANIDDDAETIQDMRDDLSLFYDNLPENMSEEINALDTEPQRLIYVVFVYFFAPFFLIIPVMVANVIAADSFVGEKERKTLEALLYTPTTDRELYFAKLIAPWLAALAVTWQEELTT